MCQGCQAGVMLSRRSFGLSAVSAAALLLPWETRAKETKSPPKPQNVLSPDAALQRLIKGNERYIEGVSRRHDFEHEREALAGGQIHLRLCWVVPIPASRPNTRSTRLGATCLSAASPAILPMMNRSRALNTRSRC